MNGHPAGKAVALSCLAIGEKAFFVSKIREHVSIAAHAGGGRAENGDTASEAKHVGVTPCLVAVRLGSDVGGQIFGPPGQGNEALWPSR